MNRGVADTTAAVDPLVDRFDAAGDPLAFVAAPEGVVVVDDGGTEVDGGGDSPTEVV